MPKLYGIIILLLSNLGGLSCSQAQTVAVAQPPVFFSTVPNDLQLFARDSTNQATVSVAGYVNKKGYQRISQFLFREGKLFTVSTKIMNPADTLTLFRFDSRIRAERAQYRLMVYVYRSATDSTLAVDRQRLVCGDVLVVYGQSNAFGLSNLDAFNATFDDTYLRTCTFPYGSKDIPHQIGWYPAKLPYGSVGIFGLSLQKLILDVYGIPTAIFNGAIGGANLLELSRRTAANPADTSTFYGRLLLRLRWAGLDKQTKALVWRQGENEAGNLAPQSASAYPANFSQFYQNLQQDLGTRFRLYVGQVNILAEGNNQSGALRDFQRRTPALFPRTAAISTVGGMGYDGIHYSDIGYIQQARDVFQQIARDTYGSRDTVQIDAPNVQKVTRNAGGDTLTLVFQPDQKVTWPANLTLTNLQGFIYQRRLTDVFFVNGGQPLSVRSGFAEANRVTLVLTAPTSATTLTYLPPYFSDTQSAFYNGPHLTNGRGLRAFSFDQVTIVDKLPTPNQLTVTDVTSSWVRLKWQLPSGSGLQSIWVERAIGDSAFVFRTALPTTIASYIDDTPVGRTVPYRYRVRAIGPVAESAPSNVVSAVPIALGLDPLSVGIRLYPNPVPSNGTLFVDVQSGFNVLKLNLLDQKGRLVHSRIGTGPTWYLPQLATGQYIADITLTNEQSVRVTVLVE